mmetsp:Transcript_48064/g.104671  ORF Transcript_48064/g.104671 Transcript_48064/m.104671 type:complete len:695 (+) Transcript_48064:102-2186(+)
MAAVAPAAVQANAPKKTRISYEKQQRAAEPITESAYFPLVAGAFCLARLVRPVLVSACFPDGPQKEDGAASFGLACNWIAAVVGFLAAASLWSPVRGCLEGQQGLPPVLAENIDYTAMVLLFAAVLFDTLHQIIALVKWEYFWGTGLARSDGLSGPLAGTLALVLSLLHLAGFLGLMLLVVAYARGFMAALRELGKEPLTGVGDELRSAATAAAAQDRHPDVEAPEVPRAAAAPAAASASTSAGREREEPATVAPGCGPGGIPRPRPTAATTAADAHAAAAAERAERPSVATPPRAWLRVESEWVQVRILRSGPDGLCTVRLPGGGIVRTRQSMLRPRTSTDEGPPPEPPANARQRPASAGRTDSSSRGQPRGSSRGTSGSSGTQPAQRPHSTDGVSPGRRNSAPAASVSASPAEAVQSQSQSQRQVLSHSKSQGQSSQGQSSQGQGSQGQSMEKAEKAEKMESKEVWVKEVPELPANRTLGKSESKEYSQYSIVPAQIRQGEDVRTAVMVRNVPRACSRESFEGLLMTCGLQNRYTFLYMPFKKRRYIHCGIAFVNFLTPEDVLLLYEAVRTPLWRSLPGSRGGMKPAVTYARLQGQDKLMKHFSLSAVMNDSDVLKRPVFRDAFSGESNDLDSEAISCGSGQDSSAKGQQAGRCGAGTQPLYVPLGAPTERPKKPMGNASYTFEFDNTVFGG